MAESKLLNRVKEHRERAQLSQSVLAQRAGVSRQALLAIEAGRQVPSTSLALHLAQRLGCRVEDLFSLTPSPDLEIERTPKPDANALELSPGSRVALGRVDGRWVAHPLRVDAAISADAIVSGFDDATSRAHVTPICDPRDLESNVLIAGCAPLLRILSERVGRRYRDARATWIPANSTRALSLLEGGMVHIAGLHLGDGSQRGNIEVLRRRLGGRRLLVVNLTRWRQGLVLPPGNPLGLREPSDLLRPRLRFARREKGAGASKLTRMLLARAGAKGSTGPQGPLATNHATVARLVRWGAADTGVAIENVALAAGLEFVPLSEERFDLVVPLEWVDRPPVSRLLDQLSDSTFEREAAALPGYDQSLTGEAFTLDAS